MRMSFSPICARLAILSFWLREERRWARERDSTTSAMRTPWTGSFDCMFLYNYRLLYVYIQVELVASREDGVCWGGGELVYSDVPKRALLPAGPALLLHNHKHDQIRSWIGSRIISLMEPSSFGLLASSYISSAPVWRTSYPAS